MLAKVSVIAACSATCCFAQQMRGAQKVLSAESGTTKGVYVPGVDEYMGSKHINLADAAAAFSLESSAPVAHSARGVRLREFRNELLKTWAALPKDMFGRIEHPTARYVLHRLFVKRHSWYIKGLDNGDVWQKNSTTDSFKDWVPAFLMDAMEEHIGHQGLDLQDLATLGAAIEDLIQKEANGVLYEVYEYMKLPNTTDRQSMHKAVTAWMVMYLGSGAWNVEAALSGDFQREPTHAYWAATERWFEGVEIGHLLGEDDSAIRFRTASEIVNDIGARYGAFNDLECQKLKAHLLTSWPKAKSTGRVRLVDFYRLGLDSEFNLAEKQDFLRSMGALDESNASSPMVIIPNYVSAKPNCLQANSLYSVCCRNECEDLMAEVERKLAKPTAEAAELATAVRSLTSDTVAWRGELSGQMLARLEGIAVQHGGEVNIHGRLFAQWMHHAFPNECPYPHEAGTKGVSGDGWELGAGDPQLSEEDRRQHLEEDGCTPEQAAAEWEVELPWTDFEELLSAEASLRVQNLTSSWHQELLALIPDGLKRLASTCMLGGLLGLVGSLIIKVTSPLLGIKGQVAAKEKSCA